MTLPTADAFSALPLDEQLALLEARLADAAPGALLALVSTQRDPAPAAWLFARLVARGWPGNDAERALAATALVALPEATVDKALRAMGAAPALAGLLEAALDRVALAQVPVMCLLDRALRRLDPARHAARAEALLTRARRQLADDPAGPDPALLAQLSAPALDALADGSPAFEAARRRMVHGVFDALAAQPKAVSQSNAEALLARQVYTDPGHFFVELLQNAVDAGAQTWRVTVHPDRVVIWHDGQGFDARDVVGVCSIGQTTKRREQIGFFGVGFKSVYEVTERPRIDSPPWRFEIADVSIPRPLQRWTEGGEAGGTTLVLPLRDPQRTPAAWLYEAAAALDPCLLITLPGLRTLELVGPGRRRRVRLQDRAAGISTLTVDPPGEALTWRVVERTVRQEDRPAGRPAETRVVLGVRCDAAGRPTPLPEGAAQVYSYLPTAERAGLRFFVQGHFDVPVDRERLAPGSAWNRALLAEVPGLLAALLRGLPSEAHARALLDVLPLAEELRPPLFTPIAQALPQALAGLPLLPGRGGGLHPIERVLIGPSAIAALFDGLDGAWIGRAGPQVFLDEGPERLGRLAAALGCPRFEDDALLGLLERALGDLPNGERPADPRLPAWMRALDPERYGALLARLARHLHDHPEDTRRVQALPVVPAEGGGLWRPGALRVAPEELRAWYGDLRPFAHPALPEEILERVGVPRLDLDGLLDELERALRHLPTLRDVRDAALPGTAERLDALFDLVALARPAQQQRLARLPLWPAHDGRLYPVARTPADTRGVLAAPSGPLKAALRTLYGPHRPIVALRGEHGPIARLLEQLDAPALGPELLVEDLSAEPSPLGPLGPAQLDPLHAGLVEGWRKMPSWLAELLAELSIWPTASGEIRAAATLLDPGPLLALCPPGTPSRALLDRRRLEGVARQSFEALGPRVKAGGPEDAARWLIDQLGRPGEPLSAQVPLLGSVEALIRLAQLLLDQDPRARVPLADARGRLRLDPLRRAPSETHALLAGLPDGAELLHPALEPLAEALPHHVTDQDPRRTLLALDPAQLSDNAHRRAALYAWLVAREATWCADPACRQRVSEAPLIRGAGGGMLASRDLVIDRTLPGLELDLRPHDEVPEALLDTLRRQLGVGTPDTDGLVTRHLRPAYDAAVAARDGARAGALLHALWMKLRGRPPQAIRGLLPGVMLEDEAGAFQPAGALLWPHAAIAEPLAALGRPLAPRPHPDRYDPGMEGFLRDLGVRERPTLRELEAALRFAGLSEEAHLARVELVADAWRQAPDPALVDTLSLRTRRWLPDASGQLRRPTALFRRTSELELLLGDREDAFPDPRAVGILGVRLCKEIGLRGVDEVQLSDVARHLAVRSADGTPAPQAVYLWLERGLAEGRLSPGHLQATLGQGPWISTDEGLMRPPSQVLGFRALELFGDRRGYWTWGGLACPRLCAAFHIPTERGPEVIRAFFGEIAEDARKGDVALLRREPALPYMLRACYAAFGEAAGTLPRRWPIILAVERGPDAPGEVLRLVAPETPGLVRSDTPTLEALFARAGRLYLATRGELSQRDAVERFLEAVGVPRLREAYTVVVDPTAGQDLTAQRPTEIQALRARLRALAAVLPRVRAQRRHLPLSGWVYDTRLAALGGSGSIRARAGLSVRLELEGVGAVKSRMPSVYDPSRATLLVDVSALDALDRRAGLLAQGLLPCVFDGPGEDQLIEILELLLPLGDAEGMNAYLDRRHFPVVSAPPRARDLLRVRLGELLDYGLGRLLARQFPELEGADFERWRDPALLEGLPETPDRAALAAAAVPPLLGALGVDAPSAGLREALHAVLAAPGLDALPAALLGLPRDPPPPPPPSPEPGPTVRVTAAPPPLPGAHQGGPRAESPPALGFWQRLRSALGIDTTPAASAPSWAARGVNPFTPHVELAPTAWATPEAQAEAAAVQPRGCLNVSPCPLPPPYLYVVHQLGGTFDPRTQSWGPQGVPLAGDLAPLRPTPHRVRFEGRLPPGDCVLPVPLFATLIGAPQASPPDALMPVRRTDAGGYAVTVRGDNPVEVCYEVQLALVPPLDAGPPPRGVKALTRPTVPWTELPEPLRRWLSRQDRSTPDPVRARQTEAFVRRRYRYDHAYLVRPDVREAQRRLRPGQGHHLLTLLHASADDEVLGRGMCGELNALIVELLRHQGVPAMLATGWMLDLGYVDRPDHLFAVAVLGTAAGIVPMPLDGAADSRGQPIHTLPGQPVPLPPTGGSVAPPIPEVWQPPRPATGAPVGVDDQLRARVALLQRAIQLVCAVSGGPVPARAQEAGGLPPEQAATTLSRELEALMPRPALAEALVALLRGDFDAVDTLPADVSELVRLGLARVDREQVYRVRPSR
ncbi:MAG: ATP-binding protein [Alphaproteobacteria bacterium]|nr:ATP-binding protein [Alphaproteobacteria bacterium]